MQCRSCHASDLTSIIPLGKLPLANGLVEKIDINNCTRHNLEVMLCPDCGLAQLKDLIDPKDLFSHYVYFSSHSETMLKSVRTLVESIIPKLSKEALVIEIASNDGYLLKNYVRQKINVLGIDPAKNIAQFANEKGIPTLCDFFSDALAQKLVAENKKADIIHANNVMAHAPDINGFIKGIKTLLKDDGYAVIEVPYFLDLVNKIEFDTIYHEHVFYFSLKPLKTAFKKQGLVIYDLEKLSIHGGTLRLFIGHNHCHKENALINEMITVEEKNSLYTLDTYKKFMDRLSNLKQTIRQKFNELKKNHKKIAAYGASAKGTTLLNFFEITKDDIDFVVDKSLTKQGLYTPGTNLLICDPEELIQLNIDVALLLSWNFKDEIVSQQQEYLKKGGAFLCPLPTLSLITH